MFKSIRWRLVLSYVLLTLITVLILGAIAFSFVNEYVKNQETAFLTANAEAIAAQASQYLRTPFRHFELNELADTSSMLGNFRVIVLTPTGEIIADSGRPSGVDQFIWVQTPHENRSIFLLPMRENHDPSIVVEPPLPFEEGVIEDLVYQSVNRVRMPWGSRVTFEAYGFDERAFLADRSSQSITLPIGDQEDPLGFLVLQEGPNFGSETLETTSRGFLVAAIGSLLLAGILGLFVARRLTSPLLQLTDAAGKMSVGDLSVRAPEFGKDEIGELAKQFNQMARRLEDSFMELAMERDTLRRFISNASHELRTPITALKNFNELLQGKARNDEKAREQFLIESSSQLDRLEWITQNLLNLSRLDGGLTQPQLDAFEANSVINSAIAAHEAQANEKSIDLQNATPESDIEVIGDKMLLQLALSNLVDNAIKFTQRNGQIKLGVGRTKENIRFWIRDNGDGIDPEELPNIFDRFYRGRNAETEGSGLGLAMVDSVVKALGGTIEVESELGAGSHFVIELPNQMQ
jgi:signal transduction histidine kinase